MEGRELNRPESTRDVLSCLLCGSTHYHSRHSLTASDILKCWSVYGHHQFSAAAVQSLTEEGFVHLYECADCGFQFFNPRLAGNSEFYQELYANVPGYYAVDREENTRNASYAVKRGYRTLLDVGCGSGLALDAGRQRGLETYGIELSRTAAAAAAQRGHKIFSTLLQDLDPVWERKFDLISFNQVLEHVSNPVELIQQCVRFLSPRGTIAVAVPGRETVLRFHPWLESDWPPHHVSRWRKADFALLARRTGLRVVETGGDPLLGSAIQSVLLGHRDRCLALGKPYRGLPPFGIALLSQLFRKTGLKHLFRKQGQTIYCFLERSDTEATVVRPHHGSAVADQPEVTDHRIKVT